MARVGFGVVGCGGISHDFHMPELNQLSQAKIMAVADAKPHRAESMAKRFRVKNWYADYGDLL